MTGILGAFGATIDEPTEERFLRGLQARGADLVRVRRRRGAMLIVGQHAWESELDGQGAIPLIEDETASLVADATLYYKADLRRTLRARKGELTENCTNGEAILAAYRVWGEATPSALEGDFAFVLWDRVRERVVCARDLGGKRPLYYAMIGDNLVVASTVSAIIAAPGFVPRLNLPVLAETCAQFWSGSDETCYLGVHELTAGTMLLWEPGGTPRIVRHWDVPSIGTMPRPSLAEGVEELRRLLIESTRERLARSGPTAVWMSGGWDSSAVFAAARTGLSEAGDPSRLVMPVSISYPEGDPGREDELIGAIAKHWKSPVYWIDVDRIPLLEQAETHAGERDLPFAHTYEHWNRALGRGSRAIGARVAFDGNGGDQLFQLSDVFLSDLLRAGRIPAVARQWRAKGGRGVGTFFDWVIAPALPRAVAPTLLGILGRRSASDFARPIPTWIRKDFVERHALVEREVRAMPSRAGYRGWRREAHFFLAAPIFPRAFQSLAGFALDGGVELRSPLYDRRVIEFACTRPREERNDGRETKRLLRAAMRGLLPDDVLAPRPRRTGITTAYSDRRMRAEFPLLLERHGKMQMLADLGIVEPNAVQRGWEEFLRTGSNALKIPLFLTLHAELWLAGHTRRVHNEDAASSQRERSYAFHD
jgi:asparagine synthase (glutamine-hydrolysing)